MARDTAAPGSNPGFLDTLTWDETRAARLALRAIRDDRFSPLAAAVAVGYPENPRVLDRLIRGASRPPLALVPASVAADPRFGLFLVGILQDGQHVFVAVTAGRTAPPRGFGKPLCAGERKVAGRPVTVRVFPADLRRLRAFLETIAPAYAPVVPERPGLGIGCRMGVLDVPVAVQAVKRFSLCASVIQSSVYRELAPLADLMAFPLPQIDLPGVGLVPLSHTGMSITGQFVAMMVERIKLGDPTPILVDADHLPLRAAAGAGQRLARRLIREAADRSLFTLDPHFCFYGGDAALASAATDGRTTDLDAAFRAQFSLGARSDLLGRYAGKRFRVPDPMGRTDLAIDMTAAEVADCALRFREPLAAIEDACAEIGRAKGGRPYAIEVSVDEVPGMSEPHHFYYLCAELQRRKVPSFSLAPGLGFSKLDVDVRDARGPFAARVRILAGIARHFGAVMGIHSGDGKSVRTREILAKATGERFWYKVSPDRQRNFFRALGLCPAGSEGRALFHEIYRAALCRVIRLAGDGGGSLQTVQVARQTLAAVAKGRSLSSGVAREVLGLLDGKTAPRPGAWEALGRKIARATSAQVPGRPDDHIVHDYAFVTVGDRDARGFHLRGRFFTLPDEALAVYHRLDAAYLANLARSLNLA